MRSWDVHLGAISQERIKMSIIDVSLRITNLILPPASHRSHWVNCHWAMMPFPQCHWNNPQEYEWMPHMDPLRSSQLLSGVVCLSWLYHHILSVVSYIRGENWVFVSIPLQSNVCANNCVHYGLKIPFVCLNTVLSDELSSLYLSESIEIIKCVSGIFCPMCVSACAFHFRWLWEYFVLHLIIIIKTEIWIMLVVVKCLVMEQWYAL